MVEEMRNAATRLLVKALQEIQKDKLLKADLATTSIGRNTNISLSRRLCFSTGFFVNVSSKGQPLPPSGTCSISYATKSRQYTAGTHATLQPAKQQNDSRARAARSVIRYRTDIA